MIHNGSASYTTVLLLQSSDNNSCEIEASIKEQLVYLERISKSRRQIALERIRTKGEFSQTCVHLLDLVVRQWEVV